MMRVFRSSLPAAMLLACAACSPPEQKTVSVFASVSREENYQLREAPMLAAKVAAGELPPLVERLPKDPRVVPLQDELGVYGGTWRRYHLYPDLRSFRLINNYWGLTRWNPTTDEIVPGLASSWEFSEDGRDITFHLRRGVHWSDGDPFDSADIAFWWDAARDDRSAEMPPEWAYSEGELMELETPDPYTVIFKYQEPYYTIPVAMGTGFWVPESLIKPSHYLKKFHPDHNDAMEDFALFDQKMGDLTDPERPTLGPWMMTYKSGTGDRIVFERNPYFWGVDPQGRQLPYIDRVESVRVQSPETGVLMITSGNVDAQFRYVSRQDYGLLKQFAEEHDYRIMRWEEGTGALFAIVVNMEHEDPERDELITNKNLREAIAYSIDRELINQVIWGGLSEPRGATITDESWHLQSPRGQELLETWKQKWSEYDPKRSRRLLDEAGFDELDDQGFRMWKGESLSLVIDVQDWPLAMDQALLIQQMIQDVGIRVLLQRDIGGRRERRIREAEYDLYMQHMSEMDLFTFPGYVFPTGRSHWHPQTGHWYSSGGEEGRAPEGWMKELVRLYDQIKVTPGLQDRHDLVLDAIEIQLQEGPFIIGTSGRQFSPVVVRENFRNVPPTGIIGPWAIVQPASGNPEQFFIDGYADEDGEARDLARKEARK